MKTTLRNHLHGTVETVVRGPFYSEVVIEIGAGEQLTAIITNLDADAIQLVSGKQTEVLISESSIFLCSGKSMPDVTASNRLHGKVMRCCEGVVCAEVLIELESNDAITATVSFESLVEMELWPGSPIWACFKASDVILAGGV